MGEPTPRTPVHRMLIMSSETATLSKKVVKRACTPLRLFSLMFMVRLSFCRLLISWEMSPRLDRNPCSIWG